MDAMTFQPNSGATGEFCGLLAIRNYQASVGQGQRNICLIPTSAHGTNPASAIKAGMEVVPIHSTSNGDVDLTHLKSLCEKHKDNLSALMITYPSTHGVFEKDIKYICELIHENGGQVYMDGANMNAQSGITSPGYLGADVCHLNLHKTFCIPHGGGGPGMGPIGVKEHLKPFLPGHVLHPDQARRDSPVGTIASAPFSSASILLIPYIYLRALGKQGIRRASQLAILNANYMMNRLKEHFPILYTNENGRIGHEFIVDLRGIKKDTGITEVDICKRLMDYGFHAPTQSFPVAGTVMVEPTESETVEELDRFCDSMINIKKEIELVQSGVWDKDNNPLKNAPHTADFLLSDKLPADYPKEIAAYPLPFVKLRGKYWPSCRRVDDLHGDKNLNVAGYHDQNFYNWAIKED